MVNVCFVAMPYAMLRQPSLALGLLKAALHRDGISSTILYANLLFADQIGPIHYDLISNGRMGDLLGEWTFAGAAFPDFHPDPAAYYRATGFNRPDEMGEVQSVRQQADGFIDSLVEQILALQPRIVACSSTFHQHCASLALLRKLRSVAPEILTVMGGANCEGQMGIATHRAFPWVDIVCSGEGDQIFAPLCRLLLDQGPAVEMPQLPYGVLGPAHRQLHYPDPQPPRSMVQHLDQIPIPDFDDYFEALSHSSLRSFIRPGLPIETSRGCWWGQKRHCTFCGLNGAGIVYRAKSPERVIRELAYLSERYQIPHFSVVDNILDPTYIETVLTQLAAAGQPYHLFYETKANLKHDQIRILAEAGIRFIQPGIESMHDQALKAMQKGTTPWINIQTLKWGRDYGIRVKWNYLYGIPDELEEWYTEPMIWLPLLAHLEPPLSFEQLHGDRFSPYHETPQAYGLQLVPNATYRFIYPLSDADLNDLAYYFEDVSDPPKLSRGIGRGQEQDKLPHHLALEQWIQQWQQLHWQGETHLAILEESGEALQIWDTRPCRQQEHITLTGLAAQVYRCCDRALSRTQLCLLFPDRVSDLETTLDQLVAQKVILCLGERVISLATQGVPPPLISPQDSPGGYVDFQAYLNARYSPFFNSARSQPRSQ